MSRKSVHTKEIGVCWHKYCLPAMHLTNLHLIECQKRLSIGQTVELWDVYELCCDQQIGP